MLREALPPQPSAKGLSPLEPLLSLRQACRNSNGRMRAGFKAGSCSKQHILFFVIFIFIQVVFIPESIGVQNLLLVQAAVKTRSHPAFV